MKRIAFLVFWILCAFIGSARAQSRYVALAGGYQSGERLGGVSLEAGFSAWRLEVPVAYWRYGLRFNYEESMETGLRFRLPGGFFAEGLVGAGREGKKGAKFYAAGGGLEHYIFPNSKRVSLVVRLDYLGLGIPHQRLADRARPSAAVRLNF